MLSDHHTQRSLLLKTACLSSAYMLRAIFEAAVLLLRFALRLIVELLRNGLAELLVPVQRQSTRS
jgi:hypothetical protein